jgi:hypothetical protein
VSLLAAAMLSSNKKQHQPQSGFNGTPDDISYPAVRTRQTRAQAQHPLLYRVYGRYSFFAKSYV